MVPNLTYDAASRAVIYNDGIKATTCAVAADAQRVLLWKIAIMKPTRRLCRVISSYHS